MSPKSGCPTLKQSQGALPVVSFSFSHDLVGNRCTLFPDHAAHENRIVDNRLRPSIVASSAPPHASKNCTSCLRAPSSFHLRSRLMISSEEHTSELQSQ